MNLFEKQIASLKDSGMDSSKKLNEKLFLLLSAVGLWVLVIVWIGAFILGEDRAVVYALGIGWVLFFLMRRYAVKTGRIEFGIKMIATLLILVILPIGFFSGGGTQGGSAAWFIFAAVYTAFMIKGRGLYFF